jgi:hypothetical protein
MKDNKIDHLKDKKTNHLKDNKTDRLKNKKLLTITKSQESINLIINNRPSSIFNEILECTLNILII